MSPKLPILHLMCGKVASGKSTLAAHLGGQNNAIVIAEDNWLHVLYSDQMSSISDYVRCMTKLRRIIGPHVVALLNSGTSVVLDFQANTVESRNWMRDILDQTGVAHELHVLDVPDDVCIARLHTRNATGDHPFTATDEQFHLLSKHFIAPSPDEGFNVVWHNVGIDS